MRSVGNLSASYLLSYKVLVLTILLHSLCWVMGTYIRTNFDIGKEKMRKLDKIKGSFGRQDWSWRLTLLGGSTAVGRLIKPLH